MSGPAAATSPVAAVLLLSLLSCATTGAGVALALRLRENARAIALGMGFSVALMVLIAVAELLPASWAALGAGPALGAAGLGAALLALVHLAVPHTHLVDEAGIAGIVMPRAAWLVPLGLALHDLPEGFAMANAYMASPALGVMVAAAIALHNVPEEFAIAVPAVATRSTRLLFGAAALSALAEPLGAVIGLAAVGLAPAMNAYFLAFAAGAMLFVSLHELVPMARRYRRTSAFLGGIALGTLAYATLAVATALLTAGA